jgi:hypothetical protein
MIYRVAVLFTGLNRHDTGLINGSVGYDVTRCERSEV